MQIISKPNLADYSSIHIGGLGNFLYLPETEEEVVSALAESPDSFIHGGGTNVIFGDSFDNAVISLAKFDNLSVDIDGENLSVSAGVKLSRVVYEAVRAGCAGLEVLAGIPGTIGGAVVMNAGGKYGDISRFVKSVKVFSRNSKCVYKLKKAEMEFGYRSSVLQSSSDLVVLGVELECGESADVQYLKDRAHSIINERVTSKILLPNCGSVYKNPLHELSAGAMIDSLGLKGYSVGGLAISEIHGNIIVNTSTGSYSDFISLTKYVSEKVYTEYGVDLELEIRVLT